VFFGPRTGSKTAHKSLPSLFGPYRSRQSDAEASSTRLCGMRFADAMHPRGARVCIIYLYGHYGKLYIKLKPKTLAFQRKWNRIIWTSVAQVMAIWVRRGQAGQLSNFFNFLYSFHFCMLPFHPLSHSCPVIP